MRIDKYKILAASIFCFVLLTGTEKLVNAEDKPSAPPASAPDAKTPATSKPTDDKKSLPTFLIVGSERDLAARESIIKALEKQVDVSYDNAPLNEAMIDLSKKLGISIQLDQKALEAAGVGQDTPVSRNLKHVSGRAVLRLMLKQLDLKFVIQNEVLLVTTAEEGNIKLEVRIYPVRDLMKAAQAEQAGKSPAKSDISVKSSDTADHAREKADDDLASLITQMIQQPTWDESGGQASIKYLESIGALVVSQTEEAHEEITLLLEGLREVRKLQATAIKDDKLYIPVGRSRERDAAESIVRALQKEHVLEFDSKQLNEVIDEIKQGAGIEIQLDQKALEAAGIGFDTPIQFSSGPKVSYGASLHAILDHIDLTYIIQGEVVLVTTQEEASAAMETRIFPVGDLIVTDKLGRAGDDYDSLVDLLRAMASIPPWTDAVGGSIAPAKMCQAIVVSQMPDDLQRMTDLLSALRQTRANNLAAAAAKQAGKPLAEPPTYQVCGSSREIAAHQAICKALETEIEFRADDLHLSALADYLSKKLGVPVRLDLRAMGEAGIDGDTPVSYHLARVSAGAAICQMLKKVDLTIVIQHEALVITTREAAATAAEVRVYPIGDLLNSWPESSKFKTLTQRVLSPRKLPPAARIGPSPPPPTTMTEKPAAEVEISGEPADKLPPIVSLGIFEELVDIITGTVDRESWETYGQNISPNAGVSASGGAATINPSVAACSLVVTQTFENHQQMTQLLQTLRQAKKLDAHGK